MQCTNCKSEILATAKFCPECGNKVENTGKTCPNPECKRSGLPDEAVFCPDCGTEINKSKNIHTAQQISNKVLSIVLPRKSSLEAYTEKSSGTNIEMLPVKGGEFMMGQPDPNVYCTNSEKDEQPQHKVALDNFLMSKFPITIYQFKKFIDDSRFVTSADKRKWSNIWIIKRYWLMTECSYGKMENINWQHDSYGNRIDEYEFNHPVVHISWYDAEEFCKWLAVKTGLKYRLPTEAEWEYAAGKGTVENLINPYQQAWAGTTDINKLENFLWMDSNANNKLHPVGLKKSNLLGLHDMCGNVHEWCLDWYDENYYSKSQHKNPIGPERGTSKVIRGGCYHNDQRWCRIASRANMEIDWSGPDIGFRIVLIP